MFEVKTTLVLGAGASFPYGFPLGNELMKIISNELVPNLNPEWDYHLKQRNISKGMIQKFGQALLNSRRFSIDEFLARRNEFTEVGKLCIALALIPRENKQRLLYAPEDDWYRTLFKMMDTDFNSFGDNNLSIVTFNYDRSLEHYLIHTMMHSYGKDEDECFQHLKKIPIVHVHGKIGGLRWCDKPARDYRGNLKHHVDVFQAADDIITISEENRKDKEYKHAYKYISNAKKVYFMGFGYHSSNLKRLGVLNVKTDMFGSSFGIGESRKKTLTNKYRIVLNKEFNKNLEFINNIIEHEL